MWPRWAEHLKDMERRFRLRTDPVFDADAYYVHEAGLSDLRSALGRGASIGRLLLSRVLNQFFWAEDDMVVPTDLPYDHDLAVLPTERAATAVVEARARYVSMQEQKPLDQRHFALTASLWKQFDEAAGSGTDGDELENDDPGDQLPKVL